MNTEIFNTKVEQVKALLSELASMTDKGGLYIEDMDCDGGLYSFTDIEAYDGNVRIQAHMWKTNELSQKTGLFRD